MKKIVAFSSIRSDYDLMSKLYGLLNDDPEVELKLIVSGAHLSKTYGFTVKEIEKDGFHILSKVETLLDSDTKQSRIKSASILLQNTIDIVSDYNPDLIMYAGDREDVIMAALIGGYLEIPTMHFFGGDHVVDGYIDNSVRHATSKLSTIHMVSLQEHKKRLLDMGEKEERIYHIGSIALDKFVEHKSVGLDNIRKVLGIRSRFEKFSLVIFHPISTELGHIADYFESVLSCLKDKGINAFVSYPNTDPGSKRIIEVIEKYKNDDNFCFYKNLERDLFLSVYKESMFLIGNSSSGITEAASVPIGVINVGERQIGRFADKNVIFCENNQKSINNSIEKVLSSEFKESLKTIKNSYGDGKSTERAYKIIKNNDFKKLVLKRDDFLRKDK